MTYSYAIDGRYIQDHFPGIGRYTFNLVDALARAAPRSTFQVLYDRRSHNTRYDVAALARHTNFTLSSTIIPVFSLREQFGLGVDAPLFHSPYYIKPYIQSRRSIVSLFDVLPLRCPKAVPGIGRRLFPIAVQLAARTARCVIVPSRSTQHDLVQLLRVSPDRIAVVPLAADARFFPQSREAIEQVRARYGLPDEYVLYVGINKPHKNLKTLIQVWRRMNDPHRILVIAGASDARYPLEDTQGIRIINSIPEMELPALYSGASVFVFPSFYEGFGLPPLEAMACGAPVISSNASSLPEVVGDAALTFDPHNPDELEQALAQVLENPGIRDELAARGIERASRFTWDQTAKETLAVYRSVSPER